ncbi:MAG: class I SAM-dependent methyltransferase [Nitrospirales bacterium]|nr:class I SAM-dependent methyltransferase [Nitrospirales bacterium]
MSTIYTSGKYLESTQTWHIEDSPWKATQISRIISANHIHPQKIVEIGCGAGAILEELSKKNCFCNIRLEGYDISPQAIELAKERESKRVRFFCEDPLSEAKNDHFDVLLAIDVFEHIPDYMGFLTKCRNKADYKIYHIPLDIHVSSVLRNVFLENRYTIGHLHYFTADSAIATLKDTGHEIVDYFYTNAAVDLFRQHPSIKKAIANFPRLLFSKLSVPVTTRIFGGYSLLVLAK